VIADDQLDTLEPEQLRQMVRVARAEVAFKQAVIDKLTHENALLKRLKFAARSEAYTAEQKSLLEETLDADLAAVAAEIEALQPADKPADEKKQPRREPLPAHLPRREVRHEPKDTTCGCGQAMQRIGEDVAEKLDYQPGVFTVERHIRGKWVCRCKREAGAGAGGSARHRQGDPDHRAARPGSGGQVPRSPAAVPPGARVRTGGDGDRALDAGAMGG